MIEIGTPLDRLKRPRAATAPGTLALCSYSRLLTLQVLVVLGGPCISSCSTSSIGQSGDKTTNSPESVSLTWQFKPGDKYDYDFEIVTDASGSGTQARSHAEFRYRITLEPVGLMFPEGPFTLRMVIASARIRSAAGQDAHEWDSKSNAANSEFADTIYSALLNNPFEVRMSGRGEVLRWGNPQRAIGDALTGDFEVFVRELQHGLPFLPASEVRVGSEWTSAASIAVPADQALQLKYTNTSRLVELDVNLGRAAIRLESVISSVERESDAAAEVEKGIARGKAIWLLRRGLLYSVHWDESIRLRSPAGTIQLELKKSVNLVE